MKTKHTPAPWRVRTDLPQPVIASESGQYVVAIHSEVNANRIVECVNACEGISSFILTSPSRKNDPFFECIELELKYNELKEVVQTIVSVVDDRGTCVLTRDSLLFLALQAGLK